MIKVCYRGVTSKICYKGHLMRDKLDIEAPFKILYAFVNVSDEVLYCYVGLISYVSHCLKIVKWKIPSCFFNSLFLLVLLTSCPQHTSGSAIPVFLHHYCPRVHERNTVLVRVKQPAKNVII